MISDTRTPAEFRVQLGRVVDMLRVINAAALTTEAEHGDGAKRGGMPVARLWETANKMRKNGYLREAEDCLPLEPEPFLRVLGILIRAGYYEAYVGMAKGPIEERQSCSLDDCADLSVVDGSAPCHIVSRSDRGMRPSCFPIQRPNQAAIAIFKGDRSANLIGAAVHSHIQTTFGIPQSEEVFRALRRLAHTYNWLRDKMAQKKIGRTKQNTSSAFAHIPYLTLFRELSSDLRDHDGLKFHRAMQLARAFIEFSICAGIIWRGRDSYNHLTLAMSCNYQWLLSTLFGLQTSMGDLDNVFYGGILLPGSSQLHEDLWHIRKPEKELVSSLAAVVQGESGSGKTTFACHLGFDIARHGGVCLYLALEQSPNDLQRAFYGFGWLPEGNTFDYLGPSLVASQELKEESDNYWAEAPSEQKRTPLLSRISRGTGKGSESQGKTREILNPDEQYYFDKFRDRVNQNPKRKGIFGLAPIRPKSWEQLHKWIYDFLKIEALERYPAAILMLDPFNAFVALADPPPEFTNKQASGSPFAKAELGHWVRAATSGIFEAAKSFNVNMMIVCEGEHMQDKEISYITNTSDLVFALHRASLGSQEPGVTEAGFHAWSRHLSIRKSRFQKTLPGRHRLEITDNGISINLSPQAFVRRLEDNILNRRLDLSLSSGFVDLDYILRGKTGRGGALCRHSFTVYMGPTGCAKSELATLFLLAPAARVPVLNRIMKKESGSRQSLLVTFRDDWASVESILGGPVGDYLGIKDLNTARETLTLLQLPVGFISASEILAELQRVFEEQTNRGESFGRVVFDNLAYMELMSPLLKSEPYFIHSLMTLLRQKGVSVLFVTSSMDTVEKSTLQAQIRDSAENVVVFDRPKAREEEVAVGSTHMAVLKSVHMEHYRERYQLSFGDKQISRKEFQQFRDELSEVLRGKDWCSEKVIEEVIAVAQKKTKGPTRAISFEPLIRELMAEECKRGNKPVEKELIEKFLKIYRMQGFLRLERTRSDPTDETNP